MATRPISRRTGSKHEMTTVSGVSSIMTSTPVAASNARIFLPSRPITRPFISSEGSTTPFVELQVAAVEGSITVIEAFLKTSKLGATGLYPRFGFIFELEGCFLGGELGLASGVLR